MDFESIAAAVITPLGLARGRVAKCGPQRKLASSLSSCEPAGTTARSRERQGSPGAPSGTGGQGGLRTSGAGRAPAPSAQVTRRLFLCRPVRISLGSTWGTGVSPPAPDVYKLRIACAERYPELIRQCELAMAQVLPNKVGRARKTDERCCDVYSCSKHQPCLFPQHGPGRKHERKIELTPWQQELVDLDRWPLSGRLPSATGQRTACGLLRSRLAERARRRRRIGRGVVLGRARGVNAAVLVGDPLEDGHFTISIASSV
jgi:hypothetical protein